MTTTSDRMPVEFPKPTRKPPKKPKGGR